MVSSEETAVMVQALRSGRKAAQAQAAGALAMVVTMHPERSIEIAEAVAIRPLVQMLRSSSPAMQRPAAQLCSALAVRCAEAIAAAGGIEALVGLLRSSDRSDVQQHVLSTLGGLAIESSARSQAIVAAGAAPLLVQLCGSSEPLVRIAAALVLSNMCSTHGSHAAVAAAGAVDALTGLLPAPVGSSSAPGSGGSLAAAPEAAAAVATSTWLAAARALQNMAAAWEPSVQAAIADSAAPAALVRLLHCSPDQEVAATAAQVFCNIALRGHAGACAAVVGAGCIPALAELLSSGDSDHGSADSGGGGDGSMAAGGADSNGGSGSLSVAGAALGALLHLARLQPQSSGAILAAGCVPLFVQMLERGDHEPTQQAAAAALAKILSSTGAAGAAAVVAAGGAEVLLSVLSSSQAGGPVLQGAAGVLQQLAAARQLSEAQAASAAPVLERLCGHTDEGVRLAAKAANQSLLSCVASPATAAAAEGQSSPAAALAAGTQQQRQQQLRQQRPPRICAAPGCGATANLRRCGGCGSVRYCGEACSKAHWRAHKAECRRLQAEQAA